MTEVKLFLVRHGETEWSVQGRAQGHADPALTERGVQQARLLAARLASVPFAAAWSSDLRRAVDSASAITQGRPLRLQSIPLLRELSYGEWEGLTYQDIAARYPAEYQRLLSGDLAFAPCGGESVIDLLKRVERFTQKVIAPADEGSILIVAHGGTLRGLFVGLLGLPDAAFWRISVAQVSLSIITLHDGVGTLELWNDTSYLEGSGV